jgi:hypothetical protein
MPYRHLIPLVLSCGVLLVWFIVPSAPVCKVFDVGAANCSSWTSGLFGVAVGGILTLWASWYFGHKSTQELADRFDKAVDRVVERGAEQFVETLTKKIETLEERLPSQTVAAIQAKPLATALLASGPLIEKLMPQIVGTIYALLPADQRAKYEAQAKALEAERLSTSPKPNAAPPDV